MNRCGSHSCGSVGVCHHGKSGPPITAHAVQMFSSKHKGNVSLHLFVVVHHPSVLLYVSLFECNWTDYCLRLTASPVAAGRGAGRPPEEDEADGGRTGQIF